MSRSILWRRLDRPGHESARLVEHGSGWSLEGTALFSEERQACRLDYTIECDREWRTRTARVSGWIGDRNIDLQIAANAGQWQVDGIAIQAVEGCIDIDLNFSASTNLLPIRRLNLAIGEEAKVRAAWLRFPSLSLEPLEQIYRRESETRYHYESAGGSFVASLEVDESGFVTDYPPGWRAVK